MIKRYLRVFKIFEMIRKHENCEKVNKILLGNKCDLDSKR